jgi:hypothetical protein
MHPLIGWKRILLGDLTSDVGQSIGSWFPKVALDNFAEDIRFILYGPEGKLDEPRTISGFRWWLVQG